MRLSQKLLALPTALLLFLLSSTTSAHTGNAGQSPAQLPNERPKNAQYSSEDSTHRKREFGAIQTHILAGHAPIAVKKMSVDESEKFYPEYWGFREQVDQNLLLGNGPVDEGARWWLRKEFEEEEAWMLTNTSAILSMRPPFLVRTRQDTPLSRRDVQALAIGRAKGARSAAAVLALLEKRQSSCPTGTSACSNAPILCCATGESCVSVTDTGIGTVGCCPTGFSCSGTIQCVAGNVPCATDIGGGCCLPGDVCATVGCIPSSALTSAVTVVKTISQTSPSSINLIVVTTVVTPSLPASTSTLTLTASSSNTPDITTTSTATATQTSNPPTTAIIIIASPSAPARASSSSDTPAITTTTTTPLSSSTSTSTSTTDTTCPTGFYACSAYYAGGCCRTGRDCATTNCPSTAYTTLISSGETIVVPLTGAATTTAIGTCASGWYNCAATEGGDCCPSGWACGSLSCTSAGATQTATEAKGGLLLSDAGEGGGRRGQILCILGGAALMVGFLVCG